MKLSKFFVATGFYPPPVRFANHEFDEVAKVAIIPYDAAIQGGAVGARLLPGILPVGAIVYGGFAEVLEAVTDGVADAATIAVEVAGTPLIAATAVLTAGLVGFYEYLIPADDPTEYVKLTQAMADDHEDQLKLTVAGLPLTAGRINFYIFYIMSRDNFHFEGPALPLL